MWSPPLSACAASAVDSVSMTQTLLVVVVFIAAVAALPWLIRYVQQRQSKAAGAVGMSSRVLSAIAVGPHQRIVTVEVGPEQARTCLVLGVTAQQITCLHILGASAVAADAGSVSSFSREMARVQTVSQAAGEASHG
jgi:flagellar protein FliO/FliZ